MATLHICIVLYLVFTVAWTDTCYKKQFGRSTSFQCAGDCCGIYPNEYCCHEALTGGIIAAIIIGCLVTIAIPIIICIICCTACCQQSRGQRGTIVAPTTGVTIVSSQTAAYGTNYNPGYGAGFQQPPSYAQYPPPLMPQGNPPGHPQGEQKYY
ncbi:hypothetical protein ScPMuIL_009393 [Solemya velum]